MLAAYAHIEAEDEKSARPKDLRTRYIIGEAGWPSGGEFWPHRTHQNGLSVDFMVPVEREGKPSSLPTWPWEKFGYGVEFDSKGCRADMCIDFKALARHLCYEDSEKNYKFLKFQKYTRTHTYTNTHTTRTYTHVAKC